ncbi:hypothetical protein [Acetobacter conturbans]|uniref:Uncharacterized protein n=1 Tax=Acetobacter conturbans TaxID=1737472 RepID=A0ABX0K472_9PROT|nr:hypothetical protein [Acetobacter conturbans]NHN88792.1 hypothetical protein [Acetobacter conturbans]
MSAYKTLREAIEKKSVVSFTLGDKPQSGSPHALGKGDNVEKVLMYRGEDSHKKGIAPTGEWSVLSVSELSDVQLVPDAPFHIGHPSEKHRSEIREVDIELT